MGSDMSKIVPVRAILPILVIFRMSPTSKAITKPEVSKARAAIQALKKVRKPNRQIAKALGYTTKGVQMVLRDIKKNRGDTVCKMGGGEAQVCGDGREHQEGKGIGKKEPCEEHS